MCGRLLLLRLLLLLLRVQVRAHVRLDNVRGLSVLLRPDPERRVLLVPLPEAVAIIIIASKSVNNGSLR